MLFPIIFDLDGTLFDCKDLTNQTFPYVLSELEKKYEGKLHIQKMASYDHFLGTVAEEIFTELLPNATQNIIKEAMQLLINIEFKLISKSGKLFDGVSQILSEFYEFGFPLFIASNGSKEYVYKVLKEFEILQYFSGVYYAGKHESKSKTDLVSRILNKHSLMKRGVIVGDRKSDIVAGQHNNLFTIGCTYGFGNLKEIKKADFKIDSLIDLEQIIRVLEST